MSVRILHFADLHLDHSFAGLGMASSEAGKRREELRAALRRMVDLALERDVLAVTVGGDLYEYEHATRDTGNFLAQQFERLAPRPVLLAPGNHDPCLPNSLYRVIPWPANVHIFDRPSWRPVVVDSQTTIWGAGHDRPDLRDDLIASLRTGASDGTALALVHASELSSFPDDDNAHCPFRPDEVRDTGVAFVLLGHYHHSKLIPAAAPCCAYPGSPEPLSFGEPGLHHCLLLEFGDSGPRPELVPINETSYETYDVDLSGMTTSDQVREKILELATADGPAQAIVRVTLVGQPEPGLELDRAAILAATADRFRYLDIVDRSQPALDLDSLRDETTTRGAFVRMMEQRSEAATGRERTVLEKALVYGLQAFAGQEVRRR